MNHADEQDESKGFFRRMGIVSLFTGLFFWLAALFQSRGSMPIELDQEDCQSDPYAARDASPTIEIFYTTEESPYNGHIFHEIKIDLAGRIYFKIHGKWEVQKNIDEFGIYNVITGEKMAKGFKSALTRAKKGTQHNG